jgi:hypothetical protein
MRTKKEIEDRILDLNKELSKIERTIDLYQETLTRERFKQIPKKFEPQKTILMAKLKLLKWVLE